LRTVRAGTPLLAWAVARSGDLNWSRTVRPQSRTGMAPHGHPHFPLQRWLVLAVALLWLSGCGGLLRRKDMSEQQNPNIDGRHFEVIAVIAGETTKAAFGMSARVRQQLVDEGWTAVSRFGRWGNESEALSNICPTADGVLIVFWDRLRLVECPSRRLAYEIKGGEKLGLPGMADRLMGYLRSVPMRR
jgi:nitrite reductase/ring-hydroxylating ferredoxin subunit